MNGLVRRARAEDVAAMVALSEQKRAQYAGFQPVFWRVAADSRERQAPFFHRLVGGEGCIALVHERAGMIDGFAIATLVTAPPVYDPGGLICLIDDFAVADAGEWGTVGAALLRAATAAAKGRGATQAVVVCGHLDEPKRAALRAGGYAIASEWYVGEI